MVDYLEKQGGCARCIGSNIADASSCFFFGSWNLECVGSKTDTFENTTNVSTNRCQLGKSAAIAISVVVAYQHRPPSAHSA